MVWFVLMRIWLKDLFGRFPYTFMFYFPLKTILKILREKDKLLFRTSPALTLNPRILIFKDSQNKGLLKTLWEKKKMLVTSIFSFFPTMFSTLAQIVYSSKPTFILSSVNALIWTSLNLCHLVMS